MLAAGEREANLNRMALGPDGYGSMDAGTGSTFAADRAHVGRRRMKMTNQTLKVFFLLGVSSKNISGKLNLAPLRPRAAPIAPMGRHNRSGGQIFNVPPSRTANSDRDFRAGFRPF